MRGRLLRRLPWGLLGMALLVGPAELFVAKHAHVFMTWIELDWKVVGRDATRGPARGADVLVFGDSMLKFGIAPTVLERRLGCRAYSLAVLDGKPAASYFLFRRAVAAGARPKVVLVDYQPECMCEPPDHLMENPHWRGLLSLRESLDVALTYRDPQFFATTALARLLPSFRCRPGVRESTLLALRGESSPNPADNARNDRNRRVNRGGLVLAKKPAFDGSLPRKFWPHMFSYEWFSEPTHTSYVRRFMSLAERHGIAVVWVLPPNTPELERVRDGYGMLDRYTRFALAVQHRYPNLYVLDGRRAGFGHELFMDPVHLDRDGALALTLDVADALRPLLNRHPSPSLAPRWLALAPPRPADRRQGLEDLNQSARIVCGTNPPLLR